MLCTEDPTVDKTEQLPSGSLLSIGGVSKSKGEHTILPPGHVWGAKEAQGRALTQARGEDGPQKGAVGRGNSIFKGLWCSAIAE